MGFKPAKKKFFILSMIFLILSLGLYGSYCSLYSVDKQNLHTTSEFSATITDVSVKYGDTVYTTIHTSEYGDALRLSPTVAKKIDLTKILSLENGQTITFRIENSQFQRFAEAGYGEAVALKAGETELLSLTEYNRIQHEALVPARIAGVVFSILFLLLAIFFFLKFKGISLFRRKKGV